MTAAGRLLPARYARAVTPLATSSFHGAMEIVVVGVPQFDLSASLSRTSTETAPLRAAHVGVAEYLIPMLPEATPTMQSARGMWTFLYVIFARMRTPTSREGWTRMRRSRGEKG